VGREGHGVAARVTAFPAPLSAFVPGTLNDDYSIKQFYERTDDIARGGAAVLIVAHTSEKSGEHGPSTKPMGPSYIHFGPRWSCYAHRSRGALVLDFDGNDGRPWRMNVSEPNGTPEFEVIGETGADELAERRNGRSRARDAKRRQICDYVAGRRGSMTDAALAALLVDSFGGTLSTHRSNLSKGAYGSARVVEVDS
jgi:hypothetical protein